MKKIMLLAFLSVLLSSLAFAQVDNLGCGMSGGMMYGMYGGYGSSMMLFSWVTYLLVIALIIAAIYWLVKSASKSGKR